MIVPFSIKYPLELGKKVPSENLQPDLFEAREGFIQLIYGRVRQGKSTEAVRRMVESLSNGSSVYSNIALNLDGLVLDDRVNAGIILVNNLLFKKRFYSFDVSNYHYFDPITGHCLYDGKLVQVFDPDKKGAEVEWLNSLTDCEIYYDEGQWLLDSYESTYASMAKRKLITESGHMNRLIVIIAQRTQSVHVNARGNVNQFFRCKKRQILFWSLLSVEQFQDMKGQDVDETEESLVSVKRYFTNKKYWSLFNTHYLRRGRPRSQIVRYEAYDLGIGERFMVAFWRVFGFLLPAHMGRQKIISGPPLVGYTMGGGAGVSPPSLGDKLESTTQKKSVGSDSVALLSGKRLDKGSIQRTLGASISVPMADQKVYNQGEVPF